MLAASAAFVSAEYGHSSQHIHKHDGHPQEVTIHDHHGHHHVDYYVSYTIWLQLKNTEKTVA